MDLLPLLDKGFAVAVAVFLLVRLDQRLSQLDKTIAQLHQCVDTLERAIRPRGNASHRE